ncbi:MAG TPA: PHB depolymerase family esterase, partial [Minicystis sp.]|nr:PHB depolymerase family esterase [Minicystis sp.]
VVREVTTPPMPDEDLARIDVAPGAHAVAVVVEEPILRPASFALRLRARGAPERALLFAPGRTTEPTCADAELAELRASPAPIAHGFRVHLHAALPGLVPRHGEALPVSLELMTATDDGREGVELTRAPLPPAGLERDVEVHPSREAGWLRVVAGAAGEASVESELLYRGALHGRFVRLAAARARVLASSAPAGARASAAYAIDELVAALARSDADVAWIERRTNETEPLVHGVLAGEDPLAAVTGVVHRAYRSPLDGSLQGYLVNVPRKYPRSKDRFPVIVAVHGLNGEPGQAMRTVVGLAPDREKMNAIYEARHLPPLPTYNTLIVAPAGYGNAGQRLVGEDDVLRVLADVEQAYRVDPDRVTITGYSLGGTVSFVVPLHYPDVFAASAPLCGYPNFAQWPVIRDAPKTPWEEVLVKRRSIVNYAENGMYLPLHMVHGGLDAPQRSRLMADRYRELGYRRILDVQDDLDHDVWEYGYDKGRMVGWLRAHKRPKAPKHVRFVTGEAR